MTPITIKRVKFNVIEKSAYNDAMVNLFGNPPKDGARAVTIAYPESKSTLPF